MEATKTEDWLVACIHSIVGGYRPFDSKEVFRTHCEWLRALDDILWVAPMGVVGRYIEARERAVLEVLEQGERPIRFRLLAESVQAKGTATPLSVVIAAQHARGPVAEAGGGTLPVYSSPARLVGDVPVNGAEVTVRWA